jgi:hypothetical protein
LHPLGDAVFVLKLRIDMFVKFAPGLFKIVKHKNEMCSTDFDELNKTNFPTHTIFSNYFEKTWSEF